MNYRMNKKNRPIFMNLLQIRMPVVAVLSFAHRLSGVMMCALIPFLIYLLDLSLRNEHGYTQALEILRHPFVKFMAVVGVWGLAHHMLAGIRFLLIDADIGVERASARRSAWIINVGGLLAPIIMLLVLL